MEDFVTFNQAVKLKELGFDLDCNYWYYNVTKLIIFTHGCEWFYFEDMTKAPTLAQAQKWLREKQNLFVISDVYFKNGVDNDYTNPEYEYIIVDLRDGDALRTESGSLYPQRLFTTYEQAISAGIDQALEMLINQHPI